MNYLLLAASTLGLTANNVCTKLFVRDVSDSPASAYAYNGGYCLCAALLFGVAFFASGSGMPQTVTLLLAAANGAFFALCLLFSTLAFREGSMSLSGVIVNSGFCVPMIYSFFVWNEKFSLLNLIGVALLLVTFRLSSRNNREESKKVNGRWLIYVALAFIGNGVGATLGKQQQKLTGGADKIAYMLVCYASAAALLFILYAVLGSRDKGLGFGANFRGSKGRLALLCAGSGLANSVGNYLIIYLALLLPAVVLYPVTNGGLAVLVSLASILFFKEKLTWKLGVAIATGVAAILLLTL